MKKLKNIIWITGIIFAVLIGVIELLLYNFCTSNVMCLGLLIIPLLPGTLLNIEGFTSVIVSLIFWFLIGSLIGLIVYKLKKK